MKIEADAPPKNLDAVQFRNWDKPGIAITADKAAQHAKNLRLVADRLPEAERKYADYLRGFADQLSPPVTAPAELEAT